MVDIEQVKISCKILSTSFSTREKIQQIFSKSNSGVCNCDTKSEMEWSINNPYY